MIVRDNSVYSTCSILYMFDDQIKKVSGSLLPYHVSYYESVCMWVIMNQCVWVTMNHYV